MRKWALLFTVSVLFLSCTKFGKNITVRGRVMNPITGSGFEGVTIQLQKVGKGLPAGYETVKETTTDATGYFEMDHLGGTSGYSLMAQTTTNEYRIGWYVDGEYKVNDLLSVTKGKKMDVVYHAVPYGEIKVNIHNISCEGGTDQLKLERIYQYDTPNNSVYQPIYLMGCYSQDGVAAKVPMGTYEIKWTVTKTSTGTNTFTGSVFVPENGVGEFTINY